MEWWGWLLLGAFGTGVIVLLIILLTRKPQVVGLSDQEREKIIELERKKMEQEIAVEREEVVRLEALATEQRKKLANLEKWYETAKKSVAKAKREEFEKYLADVNAAGSELDKLLGLGADNGSETSTSGEG